MPDQQRTGPTTVLIVDDHRTLTELLAEVVGNDPLLTCVGVATSAAGAMSRLASVHADVVVLDARLGEDDGIALVPRIRAGWPATAVVVLTGFVDRSVVDRASAAGASAVMPKDGALSDLMTVVRYARPGTFTVPESVLRVLDTSTWARPTDRLTLREGDVLRQLAAGRDVSALSRDLGISVHTARSHVRSIHAKLGVHSQLEAVAMAHQDGFVPPTPR
ncbi:response regulator transcription factor [Nocardioides sp. AX2bis]|uniref:response regulator transcription factor n=1 Tax=Nocardioides sp. AX2bis TaxID=2653157 RepID=UPI0012F0D03E|nr:response regulator transcription factor [Nocardioides sp. AX2bis]VXB16586.1 Transcriptional regulator [Nocardioides sp. AX2bis]